MSNYFTNFSLLVPLPDAAALTYALNIAQQASRLNQGDEAEPGFPAELQASTEDWCFEVVGDVLNNQPRLWLHSDSGGIDAVCDFIQHLLQKFALPEVVTFEWSHDCSKPRIDAYGGGAAIITAKKIKTMSTCQWLRKHAGDDDLARTMNDDSEANAALIAAAPELLAALDLVLARLEFAADDAEELGYDQRAENIRKDITTARAAIANHQSRITNH